ncbi:MAG: hypothetical protein GY928_39215 [Colwellia sp.]|nr:hypothetical protein [Colwellia sp.]
MASVFALSSSLLTLTYLFGRQQLFLNYPISSFAILGLNISSQSGALIYQSFTLTALDWKLYNPISTFLFLGLFQVSLLLAHIIYRKSHFLRQIKGFISMRVLKPVGLFRQPTTSMLWAMGGVGLFSTWFSVSNSVEYGDVGGKFLLSFIPFSYAPFLIPFCGKDSIIKNFSQKGNLYLIVYLLILIAVGILKNSRGTFAEGFFSIGLIFILFVLVKKITITKQQAKSIGKWALPLVFLLLVLSDLALSMTAVRANRAEVSGFELATQTIQIFFNRDELNNYKDNLRHRMGDYSETYISNPIFARLITTKFDDNMLAHSELLSDNDRVDVINITGKKIIANLPTPIINTLNLGVDKTRLEFSIEDYIWYLISGRGLGGYKVGSLTAHGIIMFGGYFYILCILLFPFLFSILDAFSYRHDKTHFFSPVVLILIYKFHTILYSGPIDKMLSFFIRTLPQFIFLYLVLLTIFSVFIPAKKSRNNL